MKKKVLSLLVTFAMLFSMLPATALAAGEAVAKIGGKTYETFSEAMTAANSMTGNVVVDICGAVEFVDGMELKGSYDSITFNKEADGASITINQTAGGDYLEAHGKTVAFNDLTLAKANPEWAGNSGHMGNYFSIQGGKVTYTNCTFPNGACTSGGTATYNNCTFQNTSEYGLWVYDDAFVTVEGGTIDSAKGIKVYSEDETSVTSTLTVKNATFTDDVTAKPAVAVGYAKSITLIGNTYYNSTGVLELDSGSDADCEGVTFVAEDAKGNDIASTLTAVDRSNSNAPCGVLVNGKIYTTITKAAEDIESGDTVTLLYSTKETVELPEGVKLTLADGVIAGNVTVAGPVLGVLDIGVVMDDVSVENDSYICFELSSLNAENSIEIKLYSGNTLLSTTVLVNEEYVNHTTLSANVEITKNSSSWDTTWAVAPISNLIPNKAELYVDGTLADTVNQINMYNTDYPANDREWKDIEGVATAPEGTITPAYTRSDAFWGEGTANATESFVVELYEGSTKIASASLNDVGDIIDGTVENVTWSIPFAGSTDEYWTVVWADGYPTATMRPDAVKLIVDGTLVDTNDVQFNAPDDLNKIVASTADSSGALTGYYTTLADALTSAKNGDKIELLWTEGDAPISMAGSVVDNKTVTITGTATVDWTKGNLFIGRGGEGNGTVVFDGANITSSVKKNPASYGIHVSGGEASDNTINYGTLEIKNSTIELDYLINRNKTVIDDNSTLTVYGGCWTHGRNASESTSGTDETATLTIGTGSTVNVINENGMGVGGEGNGVMTVKGTYNANVLNVRSKGTVNIGGSVKIYGAVNNSGSIKLTETGATLTSQQVENVTSGVADYDVEYANGAYKLVAKYVAKIGNVGYNTFEAALNAVADGKTITLLDAEGSENKEIEFEKTISFTITGKAPNYALPVVTFQNTTVNIKDAEILIPELDARQNATINVIDSKVYDAGGDSIVKSYYNGAINISGTSEVYTMQVTTMGYITISDAAKLHATWQTNVYGNGLITVEDTAVFNTAALQLTGKDYSDRDNTNTDRVGKPATIVVDGATFNVGKVLSSNGADYSYNSSYGVNIGTESGKKAELNVVNGGKVNIYMANGETANIGADGTVNNGGTITVSCRADGGTVALVNNGSVVLTQVEASLTANGVLNVTSGVEGYEAVETSGTWTVQPKTYTITFDSNGGSAVDSVTYAFGATIDNLPVPTRSGYQFEGWGTVPATMPAENLTLTAQWSRISSGGGGGGGSTSYTITVEDTENGDITVSPSRASSGSTVTITVDPDSGYELDELTVLDKNGKEIKLTRKSDSKYTFKMPSGKVTVEATFAEIEAFENPFTDVAEGAYYYDAVLWAAENGITGGTSATTFSPAVTCTRAQTVTFLWRAAGSPEPETTVCPFTDVTPDKYYYDAVLWAVENGITSGTSATTFSPNATVTRAQNVTFLWRWAESSAVEAVNPFTDVAADMYYHDAVLWAADEGITAGTSATTFSPDDPCLRSQIVTFLYRYLVK